MLGAIVGDIVGSRWEFAPTNDYNFEWLSKENGFTDYEISPLFNKAHDICNIILPLGWQIKKKAVNSTAYNIEHFAKCWQKKAIHGAISALVRMRFRLK